MIKILISQEVETVVSGSTIKHYENKGYKIPRHIDNQGRCAVKKGTIIQVKTKDLLKSSEVYVIVSCDYCGIIYDIQYKQYIKATKSSIIDKLSCYKCKKYKTKESNLLIYKKENVMSIPEYREKQNASHRHDIKIVKSKFIQMGFIPLFEDNEYKNLNSKLKCVCKHHQDIIQYKTYNGLLDGDGCIYCSRERTSGENHWNWQGGITDIKNHLRNCVSLKMWKEDSLKYWQYRCIISNSQKNLEIHHIVSFNTLLKMVFEQTNIQIKENLIDYTEEELNILERKLLQLHYYYGFGVPIRKDLHKKFHSIYGYGDNTKTQLQDFEHIYAYGDVDSLTKDNVNESLLKCII